VKNLKNKSLKKGKKMPVAKLKEIKDKFKLTDESEYFYFASEDEISISLIKVNEYELLAEETLKDVYDGEPEGLWESCLND
jgi:hypothetical protein